MASRLRFVAGVGAWALAATVASAGVIYDSKGFESLTAGTIKGQPSWNVAVGKEAEAAVQAEVVHGGSKAIQIQPTADNDAQGRVVARLSKTIKTDHYLDVWVKTPDRPEDYKSNANINLRGRDASGNSNVILLSLGLTSAGTISGAPGGRAKLGEWTRLTLHVDLANDRWALFVNGSPVTADQPFRENLDATQIDRFDFDWTANPNAQSGYFIDDLQITDTNPLETPATQGE